MLLADHDVQDHVVCVLHSDRADAAEVLDCLFDVFLDDAVIAHPTLAPSQTIPVMFPIIFLIAAQIRSVIWHCI